MTEVTKYRYTTVRPNPMRVQFNLPTLPRHYIGMKKRRNMLKPRDKLATQVYCSCGWRSDEWVTNERALERVWLGHLNTAREQMTFGEIAESFWPKRVT